MQQDKKLSLRPEAEVYKRIKKLGEGSFGKVYLVRCLNSNVLCAIKQIDIKEQNDEEKKKAYTEAKILESLKHPNIINFREVYKTKKGRLCIVMDYADGGDLGNRIETAKAQETNFSENQILDWFTQICLALKHVHDRKIIHRDLKSTNIFLTKENTIKLGDFGIATVLSNTLEKAKTIIGSPYYLSPEIIDNKPYNMKTDIWSLGIILYELCALTPPFNGNNLSYLALKIVRGTYAPLGGNISKDIKNLVGVLLLSDPNKRPNINEILKMPVITNRIKNFLSESMRKIEFSHTIIHTNITNNLTNNYNSNNNSKKPIIMNKAKANINSQKKVNVVMNNVNMNKKTKSEVETIKHQKAEVNKDNKLKALMVIQEKKEEEERKKKENREKEREEERKNMKKDIEKKKMNKNINEDFKIEWWGVLKNEDTNIEKVKDEVMITQIPVNKPKNKTETHKKSEKCERNEENKPKELEKKTRLTRDQLKQMKKNMKKSKDIPVEIYLPKTNPKQTLVDNEEDIPLVQIDLEDQLKEKKGLGILEEESKDSEEKTDEQTEKLEENSQNDINDFSNEEADKRRKEIEEKASENIDFLEYLEKEFLEIDKKEQLQKELEIECKKSQKLEIPPMEENDLVTMIEELTELINNPETSEKEKKEDLIIEEIKRKDETQEDRDDDPEDLEEFIDEGTKAGKIPVQEEINSFGFLPEKHKIESLRSLLKDVLGEDSFEKAYSIINEELVNCDLDEIDKKYGEDNYTTLFPFLPEEDIQKYLPLLFTFVIMEGNLQTPNSEKK